MIKVDRTGLADVSAQPDLTVLPYGDEGALVECPDLKTVMALHEWLQRNPVPGQQEIIPAARTILIRGEFVRSRTTVADHLPKLAELAELAGSKQGARGAGYLEIEVTYDGPDLAEVSELTGLSIADVISAHTGSRWAVAFTGFAPGFGYLTGGDPRLTVPRRADPRPRVPPGAVGLAGEFTGVYPRASPGGWQLIGHTDTVLWNDKCSPPAMLIPGTVVQFIRVGR